MTTQILLRPSVTQALETVYQQLWSLANNDLLFSNVIPTAFGEGADASAFQVAWANKDFEDFPEIEIRSATEINGANGAFSITTGKIYLAQEFIDANVNNPDAIASVLLEEYGHYLDSQINVTDSAGDEGDIFARLVQGESISESELAVLKAEDDHAMVTLDGQVVAIEQNVYKPLISIQKTQDLTEGNNSKGEFTISLDKALPQNFDLYFKVEGTAKWGEYIATQKGSDYKLIYQRLGSDKKEVQAFKGTLSPSANNNNVYSINNIPTEIEEIKITVEQVNDEVWEGDETVIITLLDNQNTSTDGYGYGVDTTKATATVTIIDNEPTVTLGKVVAPTEGFGFGSTIEGLGAALNLDGNNYVQISSNDSLDLSKTGQFTQEAWIFANLTDDDQHGILGDNNYPSIWVENKTTVKVGFDSKTFSVTNALNPNTWNHVATTFDGEEYKLYVNGVELYGGY